MLSTLQNSDNDGEGVAQPDDNRNTKKVRFKENVVDEDTTMAVDLESQPSMSWKENLFGGYCVASESVRNESSAENENVFELLEGDVNTSIFDGIPAINFSDRVKEILFKEMELTVIVKLLGQNIGYTVLHNRIIFLWKPLNPIKIMDIANGYFLVKFQDHNDYNRVLSQGPWTVYGQYLTVQPWTKHFSPLQPYPSVVLAWIRLPNLQGYLYKQKIIEAIGGLIGKVVKLDVQTGNQTRGRFARLAVYLNLDRPLISQILVDGVAQRVEYEALLTMCFTCGKYGHLKELCSSVVSSQNLVGLTNKVDKTHVESTAVARSIPVSNMDEGRSNSDDRKKGPEFGPWMLVEKKASRRGKRESMEGIPARQSKHPSGSRFAALFEEKNSNTKSGQDLSIESGQDSIKRSGQSADRFLGIFLNGGSTAKLKRADSKSINEASNSLMVTGQEKNKSSGLFKEPELKELLGNKENKNLGQKSKVSLDMKLGKRPMESEGDVGKNGGVIDNFSNSNLYTFVIAVPISDNTLDPGNHSAVSFNKKFNTIHQDNSKPRSVEFLELGPTSKSNGPKKRRNGGRESGSRNFKKSYFTLRGRGNYFKSSGNTRIPLAESMVAMAELLSSQVLCEDSNAEVDGVDSKSDCNIDPKSQV
ncbi:hypothetical protein J1N35_022145 [Gossypium stocksii]|uniref:CCHC-type domain-containing protein n=1 Tax=Gossypium stocksii TaxID=47602 RepID=A0A9D3VI05_9ROSI|nr:hypothetical protein J1N35_022145 [Gossypium stocksii]